MQPGNLMLWAALVVTTGSIAAYIFSSSKHGRAAYIISTTIITLTSAFFLILILRNRFDIEYIALNSSKSLPLYYKVSVFWAGQQGSFLFWALCCSIMGLLILRTLRQAQGGKLEPWAMAIWGCVQALFLILLLIDSPFKLVSKQMLLNVTGSASPLADGIGLKAILQNPWMVIHPPVTFIGYTALLVPAVLAAAAMISGNLKGWCRSALPWVALGWTALGAGLILGSYWAYEVLGWGGYWGWDPVENSSLVPWLTGTALLHGMIAERYRGSFRRTNVVLALGAFLFVFYATFLTRSNALGFSVHSFGDTKTGSPLLYFLITATAFFAVIAVWRWRKIETEPSYTVTESKDFAFFLAIIFIVAAAVLVLVGTSAPIIGKLASAKIDVTRTYYEKTTAPIALFVLVLMALAPVLRWRKQSNTQHPTPDTHSLNPLPTDPRPLTPDPFHSSHSAFHIPHSASPLPPTPDTRHPAPLLLISVILACAVLLCAIFGPYILVIGTASAIVVFAGLIKNVTGLIQSRKLGLQALGGFIAHIGIAILFLGIMFSATGQESKGIVLEGTGSSAQALGYRVTYQGTKPIGNNKKMLKISISGNGRTVFATPTIPASREYQQDVPASPYILKTFAKDIYVAPSYVYEPTEVAIKRGESVDTEYMKLRFIDFKASKEQNTNNLTIGAKLEADIDGKKQIITPLLVVKREPPKQGAIAGIPGTDAAISVGRISVEEKSVEVTFTSDGAKPQHIMLGRGKAVQVGNYRLLFEKWTIPEHGDQFQVNVRIKVTLDGKSATVEPIFRPEDESSETIVSEPVAIEGQDVTVSLTDLSVEEDKILLTITPTVDTVVLDISTKPFISLLWIGAVIALLGGSIAVWRRMADT